MVTASNGVPSGFRSSRIFVGGWIKKTVAAGYGYPFINTFIPIFLRTHTGIIIDMFGSKPRHKDAMQVIAHGVA